MMMKIGVVVDNEYTNDIRVTNECTILSSHGFQVKVLCLNFGSYATNVEINHNLSIHRIAIKRQYKNILYALTNTFDLYSYWWSWHIKRFIKDHEIDAIHVHDLYMSKAAFNAVKNTHIKFTLDLHENYPHAVSGYKWMNKPISKYLVRPWKWQQKEGKFLSFPEKIIVLSENFKNDLLKKYSFLNKDRLIVFPNVPDLNQLLHFPIDKNVLANQDDYVLFYFGAISKRRGIGLLFDSIEELSKSIPNLKLLLIGPVDKAELNWFSQKLSEPLINKYTIHYPWKDLSLLPSYIYASSICLSPIEKNPQHESGLANKVFQYMLFEKPIVVSDCIPQAFIVSTYKCGLSFRWNSVEDFTEKIMQIYLHPDLAKEMGRNGKSAVIEHFNSNVFQDNLLNIYK